MDAGVVGSIVAALILVFKPVSELIKGKDVPRWEWGTILILACVSLACGLLLRLAQTTKDPLPSISSNPTKPDTVFIPVKDSSNKMKPLNSKADISNFRANVDIRY